MKIKLQLIPRDYKQDYLNEVAKVEQKDERIDELTKQLKEKE